MHGVPERSSRAVALLIVVGLAAGACGSGESSGRDSVGALGLTGGQCSTGNVVSMSRYWNEAALDAVRLDLPAPTVHARNLYHLSAAMWDVWRAYETDESAGSAMFVDERRTPDDVDAARDDALAFAAHRLLIERYELSIARPETRLVLDNALTSLCGVQADFAEENPESAAAFGVQVAEAVLAATVDDGSLERDAYKNTEYEPVNPPLVVAESGNELIDPDRWQPLLLETNVAQNGAPLAVGPQTFIGSQWGSVTPFAMDVESQPPFDPGPPPRIADPETADEFREQAMAVLRASSDLEVGAATMDIGPGADDVAILTYESSGGHVENPATGEPYASNEVDAADYFRAIAEYWADGPTSETPPGHWNSLANQTSDALFADGIPGRFDDAAAVPVESRLEWDVKLSLALNGALHDAAIAAWGNKEFYDSPRPISMVRWMAGEDGATSLPLEDGLVELITEESSRQGERHQGLPVGELAVRAWAGSPDDPENETAGVEWILAADWVPFQRATFVTPAFASYVSGHSTFSRAGAEVLVRFTGSEFFPGGLLTRDVAAGSLVHEDGPSEYIELQWATFRDAADEAGRSRIWGGIHIPADDEAGREIGREVGEIAWSRAQDIFHG